MSSSFPILVTGAQKGIGKYLCERLNGIPLMRENSQRAIGEFRSRGPGVIVHCAFRRLSRPLPAAHGYHYVEDNLLLTRELLQLPHSAFVYFSSVDVYTKGSEKPAIESQELDLHTPRALYATCKLLAESYVFHHSEHALVLRLSSLFGPYVTAGDLYRLLSSPRPQLTLSPDSQLNLVRYDDIVAIVRLALTEGWTGIFNVASGENFQMGDLADRLGIAAEFGQFRYDVGRIDNTKIRHRYPILKATSMELLLDYLAQKQRSRMPVERIAAK